MKKEELFDILGSIKPSRDIIRGRRGSEENVKVKIVLPLLRFLGYDSTKDMDFELMGADIVILDENRKPVLIIETKAWGETLETYLDQCLEYTLKLKTPYVMITSGQQTALYSSLVNTRNLEEVEPLITFSFSDLTDKDSSDTLVELRELVGKNSLYSGEGSDKLSKKISQALPSSKKLDEAKKEFLEKCKGFKPTTKTTKITEDEFVEYAKKHKEKTFNALVFAKEKFGKIAKSNKNVRLRYRSKEIGLEYILKSEPRTKTIGLVGIYPENAKVAFGLEGWKELSVSRETFEQIKNFPRTLYSVEKAEQLSALIEQSIKEIGK